MGFCISIILSICVPSCFALKLNSTNSNKKAGAPMITSAQNPLVKRAASLRERKYRDAEGMFIIEGRKFTDEIPDDWEVVCFILSESFAAVRHAADARPSAHYAQRAETVTVTDALYQKITETVNPQGIMALCRKKTYTLSDTLSVENPLIIMAEALNDPGNLGTLLRTADAAGASGFILSKGCVDIYSPKVLRAAAGSIFHLPFVIDADLSAAAAELKASGVKLYAAHLRGAALPYELDMAGGCCILIGNEATGLTEATAALADARVKIPMPGRAESLNASVAGGVLIYEAVRQRLKEDKS
jgi:TrmH family RNA methyltransferase